MNYYLDLKMIPDEEVPIFFIRNKIFTKLHKTLHDSNQTTIGVSFPNYKVKLGGVIRLHGDSNVLQTLQSTNWLGGLSGYCEVSEILPVPDNLKGYRTVSRKQPTMTITKLEKRIAYQKAKGDLTTQKEVEAYEEQYKAQMFAASLDNPYLELHSSSNHNNYRIFIDFGKIKSNPVTGEFNRFGLSKIATIPWF